MRKSKPPTPSKLIKMARLNTSFTVDEWAKYLGYGSRQCYYNALKSRNLPLIVFMRAIEYGHIPDDLIIQALKRGGK